MLREAFRIGLVGLSLTACVPPTESDAYTTPAGIVYLRGSENDPWVVEHEACHWQRAKEEGVVFWFNYSTDPSYRCAEELRCNATEDHPACQ